MTGDLLAAVVGLARSLRAAGVPANTDRVNHLVASLDRLDASSRSDVYWAGRLTLCGDPDDIRRYDQVFAAYFDGKQPRPPDGRGRMRLRAVQRGAGGEPEDGQQGRADGDAEGSGASGDEMLRHKDVRRLTPSERAELQRLLEAFWLPGKLRRTRRLRPNRRGRIDPRRTVRELLRSAGDPARLRYRDRRWRPRRVVLLLDVSGSMRAYADVLLRFVHAARRRVPAKTEVFTIGTRLTRVTRQMGHTDPDVAMAAVAAAVPDWAGGTRLGKNLHKFLDEWGQPGLARGAIVVVLSDGLDRRGDVELLGEQTERLSRLAFRVIWANPRLGDPRYRPRGGMLAALPHVDALCAAHSLDALERLAAYVVGSLDPSRDHTPIAPAPEPEPPPRPRPAPRSRPAPRTRARPAPRPRPSPRVRPETGRTQPRGGDAS